MSKPANSRIPALLAIIAFSTTLCALPLLAQRALSLVPDIRLPEGQHLKSVTADGHTIQAHEDPSGLVDLHLLKGRIYKLAF
jgi:hypothetical protein